MTDRFVYNQSQLVLLLKDKALSGYKHKYYQHTVDKAALCMSIMTGVGQDEYIFEFKDKETDEQKKRRIRFYHPRTKAIANRLVCEFDELDNNDNTIDIVEYSGDQMERITKLEQALSSYSIQQSAKEYLIARVKELNFYDPNAWIVFEIKDSIGYPIEVYADQVVDFEYKYGTLQYFIHKAPDKHKGKPATRYTLRSADFAAVAVVQDRTLVYIEEYKNQNTSNTPAIRVGYKLDAETHYQTAVGILEPALEEFKALMWLGSEKDLNQKNHGFIQKLVYADACTFSGTHDGQVEHCVGGQMSISGKKCPNCTKGYQVHQTASDVMVIRMPQSQSEKVVSLSERVHYVEVPTSIIDGLKADVHEYEQRIVRTIFNAETFEQAQVLPTATQVNLNRSAKYPMYSKVGSVISQAIELCVKTTAEYLALADGLINVHQFPRDWSLERIDELINIRKAMTDAGLDFSFIETIDAKINKLLHRDKPEQLMYLKARGNHKPFKHLSQAQLSLVLADMPKNHRDRVLYYYFNDIMDAVDRKLIDDDPFYLLDYDTQKKLVDEAIQEYAERMDYVSENRISFE